MNRFQIRGMQWGAGAFLVIVGALLLIAPNQFSFVGPVEFNRLPIYGLLALFLGVALVSLSVSLQPRGLSLGVHLGAASVLLLLGRVFFTYGSRITAINYVVLAAGLAVFGLARFVRKKQPFAPNSTSLGLTLSVAALVVGWMMFFRPQNLVQTPIFNLSEQFLATFGGLFLAGGAWLLAVCLRLAFGSPPHGRLWAWIQRGAPIFTGASFLLFWAINGSAARVWVGASYFGVFGLILVFFPLWGQYPLPFEPTSLRTRLALVLAMATTLPLILTLALIGRIEADQARSETLREQALEARALQQEVSDDIRLHQAGLHTLANHPGLFDLSPSEQTRLLESYRQAYPAGRAFSLYDAAGNLTASAEQAVLGPALGGNPGFQAIQTTGQETVRVLDSPALSRPVLAFLDPVYDAQNRFVGAATLSLELSEVQKLLAGDDGQGGRLAYLVDRRGRVIVHPDPAFTPEATDLSEQTPVSTAMARGNNQGFFAFSDDAGEVLTGYARIPDLDWWILIERRSADTLNRVYTVRDQVFGLLLGFLVIAVLGGYYLAGKLITPLRQLLPAVSGLAVEDGHVPLPRTEIIEIHQLITAFAELRSKLAERTAEREQAIAELQAAKDELEDRVEARTQEIQAYANRLEQSNQELQDFAFIASHDMQEPLRKIQIFGDMLARKYTRALPEEGQDYVNRMQNAAERMRAMIEALLSYSRVSTQSQPFAPVDLNKLAAEVIDDLESSIERNYGQVQVEPLPVIHADEMQIRQLLQNLIANGLKYHRPDVEPVIRISCRQTAPDRIELRIQDNGIGIPMDRANYLFQLFHRLHGRSEFEGTGIGLAVCRKIVERHRGTIRFESTEGEGTTFIISLPV